MTKRLNVDMVAEIDRVLFGGLFKLKRHHLLFFFYFYIVEKVKNSVKQ